MTKKRLLGLMLAIALCFTTTLIKTPMMVFADDETAVAKVGETEYETIDQAISNWTNGKTLTLLKDVTLSDTIVLKSTEHHILDLGTFTMTAASKKDAIQIENNGRSSASYALDITADADNPGGITATGKAIVRTTGKTGVQDRPIIRFYDGVFNASYIFYHSGSNGTNCPQFYIYGGEYYGTLFSNRALIKIYGGTFHGSLMLSVDSSAYALISGGKFKSLSNLYMSSLSSSKFTIGSNKGVYDSYIYIDKDGYYVVTTSAPDIDNGGAVVSGISYTSNNYFYYSKLQQEGSLYYEDATMAFKDSSNKNKEITVYPEEDGVLPTESLEITSSFIVNVTKEDAVLPSKEIVLNHKNAEFTVKYNDISDLTNLNVKSGLIAYEVKTEPALEELNIMTLDVEEKEIRYYLNKLPTFAKIGSTEYPSLLSAVENAQSGDVITLLDNVCEDGFIVDKDLTIDLNDFTYTIEGTVGSAGTETNGLQLLKDVNVTIKNGTITSTTAKTLIQNYANLTLENVTLKGDNLIGSTPYTLSNNCGNVTIKNSTVIASENGVAFDVCEFASYTAPTVTVENSTITGKIEMTDYNGNQFDGKIIDGNNTYTELGNYLQINSSILPIFDYNLSLNVSSNAIHANDDVTVEVVIDKAYYSVDYAFTYDNTKFSCAQDENNDGVIEVKFLTTGDAGVLATYSLTALNEITKVTTTDISVNGNVVQHAILSLTDVENVVNGETEQVKISLDYTAEIKADYVTGYSLVIIKGEDAGYAFDNKKTFYVTEYEAYAVLVEGEINLDQIDVVLSKAVDCKVITKSYDVNAEYVADGVIDLKDATAIFACYSLDFDVNEYLELFLRADVNNDYLVNYSDVNTITANYTK